MKNLYRDKRKKKNFTMIQNKVLQDNRIHFCVKGLLTFLLSLPDDWEFTVEGTAHNYTADGVEAIRSQLNVLKGKYNKDTKQIENRYVFSTQLKQKNGRFGSKLYVVDDEPLTREHINRILAQHGLMLAENEIDVLPLSEKPLLSLPSREIPSTENPEQTNNIITKTKEQILSCPVPKSESNCNLTEETEDLSEIDFDMTDEEESYDALSEIEEDEEEAAEKEPDLFDVEKFKAQISYDKLVKDKSDSYTEQVKALLGVVSNALNHKEKLRISGRDMPLKAVADKFSLLRYEHILDVLETINRRLSKNKKPRDPKAYLLTMLYNSVDEYESKHISAFDKPVPETGNSFDLDEIEIIENSFAVSEDTCPSFTLEDLRELANNFDNFI